MLNSESYPNIEAAILAGGENKRFEGKIKANMRVGERTIIEKTLNILDSIFSRTIIVTNYPDKFRELDNYLQIEDIYKGVGPLGGIHSALTNSKADFLFIVASDMPELSGFLIQQMKEYFLLADCEILIPRFNDKIEPLHGFYKRDILPRLDKYLGSSPDHSIRSFFREVKVEYLDIIEEEEGRKVFININSQKDLDEYLLNQKE